MIINFPSKTISNHGGLKSFKFIQIQSILSFPAIIQSVCSSPISIKNGFTWLTGYATPETLLFIEQSKQSENGKIYEQTVTGFAPGDKTELIALFEEMEDYRFLLLLEDFKGVKRLIGHPSNPLNFSNDFSTGQSKKEAKGFQFNFNSISTFKAPVYPF